MELTAEDSLAAILARNRLGIAMAAITRMMATTISNSINENPRWRRIFVFLASDTCTALHLPLHSGSKSKAGFPTSPCFNTRTWLAIPLITKETSPQTIPLCFQWFAKMLDWLRLGQRPAFGDLCQCKTISVRSDNCAGKSWNKKKSTRRFRLVLPALTLPQVIAQLNYCSTIQGAAVQTTAPPPAASAKAAAAPPVLPTTGGFWRRTPSSKAQNSRVPV